METLFDENGGPDTICYLFFTFDAGLIEEIVLFSTSFAVAFFEFFIFGMV